jgi:hypothetical protein
MNVPKPLKECRRNPLGCEISEAQPFLHRFFPNGFGADAGRLIPEAAHRTSRAAAPS